LRSSCGGAVTVSDLEIQQAWRRLARRGFYVEPTSAVAAAGLQRLFLGNVLREADRVAVVLTGSGLKVGSLGVE
jgi:threonine synthase